MKYTIIAECGINHLGNMDYARKSIEVAKECGADIWKTQLYHPESLFPNHEVIVNGHNYYNEVVKTELSFDQVSMLKKYCDKVGIEFLASAFDTTRLHWLEMLHVKRHKIATRMNTNKEYVNKVILTGKEVLFSTTKRLYEYSDLTQLYCVPKYPTMISDIALSELYQCQGFSDHTIGIEASVFVMANVYEKDEFIIEKHFTLNRSDVGCDQIISIEPQELKQLVKFARAFEEIDK